MPFPFLAGAGSLFGKMGAAGGLGGGIGGAVPGNIAQTGDVDVESSPDVQRGGTTFGALNLMKRVDKQEGVDPMIIYVALGVAGVVALGFIMRRK